MARIPRPLVSALALATLAACGGGGGDDAPQAALGSNAGTDCTGSCATSFASVDDVRLTDADVERVLAQTVAQAQAMGTVATIAVVDRVGNVLAVYRMDGVVPASGNRSVSVTSGLLDVDVSGVDGLEIPVDAGLPGDGLAALAKAITGAFLSSEGNAFSTRTANQIVQRHFNPGENNQPGGPLFGVQFSQLPCSDFSRRQPGDAAANRPGPKRSPLGLSADPGGFPLYKNGTPVGGVGVISSNFVYGLDPMVTDVDRDPDEIIALAGTFGFAAPTDRQAERITVEGKVLRFSDAGFDSMSDTARQARNLAAGGGNLITLPDYFDATGGIVAGTAFGQPESGIRAAGSGSPFAGQDAFVFVDETGTERYPPTAGGGLTANEVQVILQQALGVANSARAQIRRPLGSPARVTIAIVDEQGNIRGMVRGRDAPVFGADVSLQKARTAALFSSTDAGAYISALPDAQYVQPDLRMPAPARAIALGDYVTAARDLIGPGALSDGTAFSDRAGGNLSRPNFPDGINEPPAGRRPPGPFSKPPGRWSPFSTGLQLDLSFNAMASHLLFEFGLAADDIERNCVGVPFAGTASGAAPRVANGAQIFPGSVPIYRGDTLIGGIGVSGDGIDQDDMIAFLGLHRAAQQLATVNNAPPAIRADRLEVGPDNERLRYVNCPFTPFNDSDAQRVCEGK
ncbi:heme-binding protein [Salinisphaera sp. P385]|uniref:Heme-binding protein n=1 Tax=Spectribacter acetivorans TaxID=3075603 RepID=A0ABU3B8I9_9GAMM|nr:heme-binding protein [Salinisphaera sp. P385]MDT0618792.1 heme-binding protein [Salinisphaera sp. P385]